MIGFVSIVTGILVVLVSVFLIRREFQKTIVKHPLTQVRISDENTKEILNQLMAIEATVEQMNGSFYDLVGDLEGKYSVHDKEIDLIQEDIEALYKKLDLVGLRKKKSQAEEVEKIEGTKPIVERKLSQDLSVEKNIQRLRDEGQSINQIARQLDIGVGEVVLHLKKVDSKK